MNDDRDLVGPLVIAAAAGFGVLGAYSSFEAVRSAMEPSFGADAWTVPIGIDLGIAAAAAGDLWMAARDWRTWWLRYIPHGLSLVTVYLNVVGEEAAEGRVAHAGLVFLWIAFVTAVAHVVKLQAVGRRPKTERMDSIRGVRWFLAPLSTAALWRWMVTNEETSYRTALRHRDERRLTRAELRDAHGAFAWRWRQSWRDRELYRQGRPVAPKTADPDRPTVVPAVVSTNGDAIDALARQMKANGEKVTRRSLLAKAKAEGHPLGTKRAAETAARHQ